jgi:hypothetical protein
MKTANGTNATTDGWLSRKHWRRLLELRASGRITRMEFETLKLRLTRVRRGPLEIVTRLPPRLTVIAGGASPAGRPTPSGPAPRRAA